jgi:arsenite methyltransferase
MMTECIAGAAGIDEVADMLRRAGFADIRIKPRDESREFIATWAPGRKIEDYLVSATIEAIKPHICASNP